MINDKLKQLIQLLTTKTKNKEALWNKSSGENQFQLILPDGIAVTIGYYQGGYNNIDYCIVSIYNKNGDVIQKYITDEETPPQDFELLKLFHQSASDEFYKVEETFDALLKSVNSQGIIGTIDPKKKNDLGDDLPF